MEELLISLKEAFAGAVNPQFTAPARGGVPAGFPVDGAIVTFDVATLRMREPYYYEPVKFDRTGDPSTLFSFECSGTWEGGNVGNFAITGVDGLALLVNPAQNTAFVAVVRKGNYRNAELYHDEKKTKSFGLVGDSVKKFIDKFLVAPPKSTDAKKVTGMLSLD